MSASIENARQALEGKFHKDLFDVVKKPAHYNHGKLETIDVIEDWELSFHCGNAVKYISRHKHKGTPIQDIKKAVWYLQRYLQTLEGE